MDITVADIESLTNIESLTPVAAGSALSFELDRLYHTLSDVQSCEYLDTVGAFIMGPTDLRVESHPRFDEHEESCCTYGVSWKRAIPFCRHYAMVRFAPLTEIVDLALAHPKAREGLLSDISEYDSCRHVVVVVHPDGRAEHGTSELAPSYLSSGTKHRLRESVE